MVLRPSVVRELNRMYLGMAHLHLQGEAQPLQSALTLSLRQGPQALVTSTTRQKLTTSTTFSPGPEQEPSKSRCRCAGFRRSVQRGSCPDTVNTLPEATIAFENHGTLNRTIDTVLDEAQHALERIAAIGIDMVDVGRTLEDSGVAAFHESFAGILTTLDSRAQQRAWR